MDLVGNPKDSFFLCHSFYGGGNQIYSNFHKEMSLCMRKPTICIGENKAADQLRGNREADQRLCFRYTDSTIPLLPKSKISSL